MRDTLKTALSNAIDRIQNGYPIAREVDFQSVLFGEFYKAFPEAIIRFEHSMSQDYQSYHMRGTNPKNRKSRVDLFIETKIKKVVVELKYFKGASKEDRMDMLADIAKVERIVESKEAHEGFCIQLVKSNVIERLPKGEIERCAYSNKVGRWDYNFEIKGHYSIEPELYDDGKALIFHHIKSF